MRRAGVAVLLLAPLLSGCGLVGLVHDSMLGPVSPAGGNLRELMVGTRFHVTREGPVADVSQQAIFRPYPVDLVQRTGTPKSLYSLVQGLQAIVAGISPVVQRSAERGRLPEAARRLSLEAGDPLGEVLTELGPPELWVRRPSQSLLLYRRGLRDDLSLYVGVPPLAGALLPVPGVGNLRFRWASNDHRAEKLLLVFDGDDRLRSVSVGEGAWSDSD